MPLTIEQQRALAIAQAKRKRAEAEAGPSLRSETDAIIEEAAAAIPGGFAAFDAKPADPKRMAAMGYVQDPLAKSGYARPQAQQPRMADTGNQNSLIADVARGLEAPVRGLTGGGLEGWARTTQADPLLGATQAVDFISPVDDLGRAYQGVKQAGAGLIEGDMGKAAQGAQQASIDGSFAALQMLPGSMTLRGMSGPRNALAPTTLAGAERAAVQATRAPPIRKPAPQVAEPVAQPAPFSAPAEPKASGFLRNNADRIVGGGVGAFAGGAGDALAGPGDGNQGGGPDIINPVTGGIAGMIIPRAAARGYRGLRSSTSFDERVAARAVRNVLSPAGIKSAEQAAAEFTARFGDKPASVADLAQGGVGLAANLSRLPGATGEAALARGEQLLGGRAGRLERDIGQAAPGLNPGAITGDVDRMIALAQEQAKPAYDALKQQYPPGSVNSPRLAKIEGIGSHIKAVDEYRAATKANEGRDISDFEYWDLVKRDIDAKEQQLIDGGATLDDIRVRKLEGARAALVKELDDLMGGYAEARQLGGEAPRMREAFKQGQRLLDGTFLADEVSNMIREVTGQQLTATQAGVIRNMMKKTQSGRTAMAALMSSDARKKLEAVFGKEASDAMQARFAADAAIMTNMQRISPNVGSVTSQAGLGGGGGVQQAAELAQQAVAFKTNPLAAVLAGLSKSGTYTKSQRDRMGEMLLGGNDPANLARIYGNRPPRNPLNVEPPPTPQGPPTNALAPRRPEQAGFGGSRDLPMDEASRKARAEEQGFDTRYKLFHATSSDFDEFDTKKIRTDLQLGEDAIFLTNSPAVADSYLPGAFVQRDAPKIIEKDARGVDMGDGVGRYYSKGSAVYPVYARNLKDYETWDMGGGGYDPEFMQRVIKEAKENGAPGVILRGVRDPGIMDNIGPQGNPRKPAAVVVVFDPKDIRSVNAKFDPSESSSSKLLAGMSGNPEAIGAAGGTAIGMATAPDQNGDGVVDAQERLLGGAGGALTGGIAGRGVRAGMNALAPKPSAPIVKPPTNWPPKPMADPPAPGKIRAYHGSKHEFDQFALTDETVGTGEGTQSRGYGLYFAERPNLANFYRSIGQNSGSPEDFAGSLLYHEGGDVEKVRAFLKGEIKKAGRTDPTQYKRALDALNKGRATDMSAKQGAFYEVDLDAQGDDLFDLDAPLSGQSEIVQSRVADAWRKMKGDAPLDPQTSGYDILMAMGNDKAASEALSANGIKGAQFLDRASREAKSGTRNYVMFDPKNVDVRKKQTPRN